MLIKFLHEYPHELTYGKQIRLKKIIKYYAVHVTSFNYVKYSADNNNASIMERYRLNRALGRRWRSIAIAGHDTV